LAAQLWNFARIGICHTLLVDGKWVTLRVPYPMGFFAKWSEGRIDDPNAGWKGRSLWATHSTRTVFHVEGGKENRPRSREVPAPSRSARAVREPKIPLPESEERDWSEES